MLAVDHRAICGSRRLGLSSCSGEYQGDMWHLHLLYPQTDQCMTLQATNQYRLVETGPG